jgi:hypothetical protein
MKNEILAELIARWENESNPKETRTDYSEEELGYFRGAT